MLTILIKLKIKFHKSFKIFKANRNIWIFWVLKSGALPFSSFPYNLISKFHCFNSYAKAKNALKFFIHSKLFRCLIIVRIQKHLKRMTRTLNKTDLFDKLEIIYVCNKLYFSVLMQNLSLLINFIFPMSQNLCFAFQLWFIEYIFQNYLFRMKFR
jgi:hypothetical protein